LADLHDEIKQKHKEKAQVMKEIEAKKNEITQIRVKKV
jgi:hypothetical protein